MYSSPLAHSEHQIHIFPASKRAGTLAQGDTLLTVKLEGTATQGSWFPAHKCPLRKERPKNALNNLKILLYMLQNTNNASFDHFYHGPESRQFSRAPALESKNNTSKK